MEKAPDKIYVFQHGINAFDAKWHFTKSKEKYWESHEYIRKDALLEWAKKEEDELDSGLCSDGFRLALTMLKQKLESL